MVRYSQMRRWLPLSFLILGESLFAAGQDAQTEAAAAETKPKPSAAAAAQNTPPAEKTATAQPASLRPDNHPAPPQTRAHSVSNATSSTAANPSIAEAKARAATVAATPVVRTSSAAPAPVVSPRDTHFFAPRSDLVIRVNAANADPEAPIRWNQLVYKDGQLVFGAREGLGSILWETALDLGDYAMQSLWLIGGRDAKELAALSMQREIIGRRGLALQGDGRMDLTTANPNFTGPLKIDGAELRLREDGTLKRHPSVHTSSGGSFVIDNRDVQHVVNKRFNLTRDNAAALERLGTLTVQPGANQFIVSGGGPGKLGTTITIAQLRFSQPAAHLNFVATNGSDFSQNTTVKFLQRPELLHGVIAHTTVNGRDWATIDTQNRLTAYAGYETGSEKKWGPTVNAAPAQDQRLTADRSLASLKFEGEGLGGTDEDRNPLGRIVDLHGRTLTLTGAGIIADTGDDYKHHQLLGGTLTTTQKNYEIHVTGTGGLDLVNTIITDGPNGPTGLIKTGDGELVLNSLPQIKNPAILPGEKSPPALTPKVNDNSFTGDVYVNQGKLVLFRKKSPTRNIPGLNVYVGAGQGNAMISVKGASEQINQKATVTLRGGPKGEAVLRLDRNQAGRGPRQTLQKLVIEGSGVIEFYSSYIGGGGSEVTDNSRTILYLNELEINGELVIRGWDKYNTHILIDSATAPSEDLLSKIRFDHWDPEVIAKTVLGRFKAKDKGNREMWEIKGEFTYPPPPEWKPPETPEPATSGFLIATGAAVLAAWHRRRKRENPVGRAVENQASTARGEDAA